MRKNSRQSTADFIPGPKLPSKSPDCSAETGAAESKPISHAANRFCILTARRRSAFIVGQVYLPHPLEIYPEPVGREKISSPITDAPRQKLLPARDLWGDLKGFVFALGGFGLSFSPAPSICCKIPIVPYESKSRTPRGTHTPLLWEMKLACQNIRPGNHRSPRIVRGGSPGRGANSAGTNGPLTGLVGQESYCRALCRRLSDIFCALEILTMRFVDGRTADAYQVIAKIRAQLSPEGEVISPASRQKTIDVFGEYLPPQRVVERICSDIAARGMEALLGYLEKLDGVNLSPHELMVPHGQMEECHRTVGEEFLKAIRRVRGRIEAFQSAIRHRDVRLPIAGGYLEERYRPLGRVGVCVPGGAAAYPSTVLMTVVPAQVAGVEEIIVASPPTSNGAHNPFVLATCWELGVKSVLRVGGAHGVAALAYGVGVPPVDKIVGPGNLFVALAKKFVFGRVAIDNIAGPSEVVLIADGSAEPEFLAYDLIAQAEHAPGTSILLSWEEKILRETLAALDRLLAEVDREEAARESLETFGAAILVQSPDHACRLAVEIAPEHLHIVTENPDQLAEQIPTAGAVFLGNYSPVAVGDYAAGPSHVLPTSGTARFAAGLSVNEFLRSHSVICLEEAGLRDLAEDVRILAECEGLTAHRDSVLRRLEKTER